MMSVTFQIPNYIPEKLKNKFCKIIFFHISTVTLYQLNKNEKLLCRVTYSMCRNDVQRSSSCRDWVEGDDGVLGNV